ncbi:hypothetical protein [Micromonospora aurantiaca (nom. illeg.)]|uniref:hypothetical protein n=1 Tax=Micromonospora aurantiaca (nom. illeg.) TaxID=47850 RepID=UPI0033DD442B
MTYPGVNLQDDPERRAVEERRRERADEFGTYRATQDIPWGNVTAFFAGEVVPKSTVEHPDKMWHELGLVERIPADEPAAPTATAPAGTPPARNASQATWVDYAVARGADRTEAQAKTRDDLVAQYAPQED